MQYNTNCPLVYVLYGLRKVSVAVSVMRTNDVRDSLNTFMKVPLKFLDPYVSVSSREM